MRFLKFLLSLAATCGLVYALSTSFAVKGVSTPKFGDLLNPFSGFWQNATASESATFDFKNNEISGLKGAVKVTFDDREVPHIFAENTADAIFMQGYIHAQNRLFQMDIATRSASGRLSEVIADPKALESDMNERRYGMLWAAENALKGWQKDKEGYALLESYVAGVNAYIENLEEKNYPVEFKILGYKPEKWTTLKSALFFKVMCKMLARQDLDVDASNSLSVLGEKDFQRFLPEMCPDQKTIVPSGTKFNFKAKPSAPFFPPASFTDTYRLDNDMEHVEGIGSNSWVVGPKKALNGKPILCGDPHLGLGLPAIWYECQLSSPDLNAYGVSLAGMPFIVIGFNNNIAWTQTNSMHDVAEWYKIKWKDNSREQYELDGKWVNVDHKVEEYHVKGRGLVKDVVKYTKFGPVVVENSSKADDGLAFRWICHDESKSDINVFYKIDKAQNFDEFKEALREYSFPMQNYTFASNTGDYAIYTQGRMPVKKRGEGRFVSDGSKSSNVWSGDVPFEHMPCVKNHASGFVMSANQNQTDATYPYDYHSYLFEPTRGRIIHRKLTEMDSITVDDMKKLHSDSYSLEAEEFLPLLLANIDESKLSTLAKPALEAMKTWDKIFTKDSKAAMFYDQWQHQVRKQTWDELSTDVPRPRYLVPRNWVVGNLLKNEPNNKYFDLKSTPEVENGKALVTIALNSALDSLDKLSKLTLNPDLNYGDYKNTRLEHAAKIPGLGKYKISTDGNGSAINCIKGTHGPSWRMIVEPGENPKAWVVYPGGQTGNVGSKKSEQFVEKWANGDYYEAIYLKKADDANERMKKVYEFKPKSNQ